MSLRKVFSRIEAFKEDMEKLGVRVTVTVEEVPVIGGPEAVINLKAFIREELEDLEARPCKHGPIPKGGCPKDPEAS